VAKTKEVGSEVFTAVTMKNATFWDLAPYRSCVNQRFGGTYILHLQGRKILVRGFLYPEEGSATLLRNVGAHKIYTAPHPRRRNFFKSKEGHIHLEAGYPVPGLRFRNYAPDKEPRKSGPSELYRFTFRP
jgi:hypothetical protein